MFMHELESIHDLKMLTVESKLKDFIRSQTVIYTVKVVVLFEMVQDRDVVTTDH